MWKSVAYGYEVSTDGNVRSFKGKTPRILKSYLGTTGYLVVNLQINGKQKICKVHRLVAEAFIPNPLNLPQVNHRNGIKTDNRVENLEWCTRSENMRHAVNTGLQPTGELHSQAKLTDADVRYIRDNPDVLTQAQLADKFGVIQQTISLIQLGKHYRNAGGTVRNKRGVPADVRDEIRRLYVKGDSQFGAKALANRFGVDPKTVRRIVKEAVE